MSACNCLETVDKMLAPHNTRLSRTIVFSAETTVFPTIQTEQVEQGRSQPKAKAMLPTFCPFCGVSYNSAKA